MAIMGYWKRGIPWTDAWVRRILLQGIPEFPWGYTSRIILGVSRPLSMYVWVCGWLRWLRGHPWSETDGGT